MKHQLWNSLWWLVYVINSVDNTKYPHHFVVFTSGFPTLRHLWMLNKGYGRAKPTVWKVDEFDLVYIELLTLQEIPEQRTSLLGGNRFAFSSICLPWCCYWTLFAFGIFTEAIQDLKDDLLQVGFVELWNGIKTFTVNFMKI